jgi:hypothetical protein
VKPGLSGLNRNLCVRLNKQRDVFEQWHKAREIDRMRVGCYHLIGEHPFAIVLGLVVVVVVTKGSAIDNPAFGRSIEEVLYF